MTEEEKRAHAERLIRPHNDEYEFSDVCEGGVLGDASENDQWAIHDLMQDAKITITREG